MRIKWAAATSAVTITVSVMAAVPAQALPVVNMEKVLLAAQIDPRRPDSALTPGAKDHVLAVEQALQAKGFLAAQYVDGHFGTTTTTAYTNLQKSFGWTGLDTNGIPGETSLKRLGKAASRSPPSSAPAAESPTRAKPSTPAPKPCSTRPKPAWAGP